MFIDRLNLFQWLLNSNKSIIETCPYSYISYNLITKKLFASTRAIQLLDIADKKNYTINDFKILFQSGELKSLLTSTEISNFMEPYHGIITLDNHTSGRQIKHIKYYAKFITNNTGQKTLIIWFADYTDTIRDELDLIKYYKKYQISSFELALTLEHLPFPIWKRDNNGEIILTNKAYIEFNKNLQITDPKTFDILQLVNTAHKNSLMTNTPLRKTFIINNVATVYEFQEYLINNELGNVGFAYNVTEYEKNLKDLAAMEELTKKLIDSSSSGYLVLDTNHKIIKYNSTFLNLFGLEREILDQQPSYRYLLDFLKSKNKFPELKDFRDNHIKMLNEIIDSTSTLMHLPDGKTFKINVIPTRFRQLILIYENLSITLEIERKLQTATNLAEAIMHSIPFPSIIIGSNGMVKLINKAFISQFGMYEAKFDDNITLLQMLKDNNFKFSEPHLNKLNQAIIGCLEHNINQDEMQLTINDNDYLYSLHKIPDLKVLLMLKPNIKFTK